MLITTALEATLAMFSWLDICIYIKYDLKTFC